MGAEKAASLRRRTGVLGAAQVVVLGLNFVTWVHLGRTLAPEGFGVLTFGTALLAYFALAVVLGFEAVGMREVAREPERVRELASSIVGMRLVLCVVVAALYALVVVNLPQPPAFRAVLATLGGMLLVRATQLNWAYVGLGRVEVQAVRDVLAALGTAAGAWVLVHGPTDLTMAAAVTVVPPLILNGAVMLHFVRRYGPLMPHFDRTRLRSVLLPALPLAASAFLSEVYYSLDKVLLEGIRSTSEVGLYGAAYKLLTLALAPSLVLYQAFFPALSSALGNPERMRKRARAFARVMISVGLPVALAGPVLAQPLVTGFFGDAYAPASLALSVLLVNAGVVYVAMSVGNPLMAWNHERPYMWAIAAGAGANVLLNVALIPPFGIAGAAVATLASEVVVLAGLVRAYRRLASLEFDPFVLRAGLATVTGALLPALACRSLHLPLPITLGVVAAGYGLAMWGLGCIRDLSSTPGVEAGGTDPGISRDPRADALAPGISSVS